MRIANLAMAAVFLFGAIVQLNDPDPVLWSLIYLAAAAACLVGNRNPMEVRLPAVVAVLALAWAAMIALQARGWTPFLDLFAQWEMRDDVVEETRETYGLLIIAAWMIVLAVRARTLKRREEGTSSGNSAPAASRPVP